MKPGNLKIRTQLALGLGVILVMFMLLGALAWRTADSLWQWTESLYSHPFQVRRALGEIKADILSIQLDLTGLALARNGSEIRHILQDIDTREADTYRQFQTVTDSYLGPADDVERAYTAFLQWKALRDEEIRLVESGRQAEAAALVAVDGVGGLHVEKLLGLVAVMDEYARARADQFFQQAQAERSSLEIRLWTALVASLVLSGLVAFLLFRSIRRPLGELTLATRQFSAGDLDARSQYVSKNEFGALSVAFNSMADTVRAEMQGREYSARVSAVMLAEQGLRDFCRELLKVLLDLTGSQVGAVYLLNEAGDVFEHFESIGLGPEGRQSFSASLREGEFGLALATRKVQRLTGIPEDTHLGLNAVAGDFRPAEIITIPVLAGENVVAVISLAGLRPYPPAAIRLVDDIHPVLCARLNGVLAFQKVSDLSGRLDRQNRELEAQTRELSVQADELTEQNTELEQQKKGLGEISRLKSAFLSNMSHELRTPLNSVIALAGVLGRRLKGTVPAEEYGYLEVIERNGQRLLALVNDILDLSRIEAGREEVEISRFSAGELVSAVTAMVEPQAREKDIVLINRVGADLPPLESDYSKVQHILQNLVGNAVKFTEAGQVAVTAERVDGSLEIAVADTGIGIAPDQLPFIFDEFRQGDGSTSRKYGGTGLGLAIARKYIDLLKGSIRVESRLGQGSTFTVRLPLALASAGQPAPDLPRPAWAPESAPVLSPALGEGKTILVVEDSEPATIQLREMLQEFGYRVEAVADGRQALERVGQALPDAILLDLMMAGVDGFEVLRQLREAERTRRVPVLILTAKHVSPEELKTLKYNNIHQLLQKGAISKRELVRAVVEMTAPAAGASPSPRRAPARRPVRTPPLVLVAEDNADNLLTVKAILRESYRVIEAPDGREALAQARQHQPDLILMDISLPGMDGFAVLAQIRQDEALRSIPVIALTARAMKGDREEILGRGFDGYVSKPLEADRLAEAIREVLHAAQ